MGNNFTTWLHNRAQDELTLWCMVDSANESTLFTLDEINMNVKHPLARTIKINGQLLYHQYLAIF